MQQILFSYFLVKNAMSYRIIYELRESTGLTPRTLNKLWRSKTTHFNSFTCFKVKTLGNYTCYGNDQKQPTLCSHFKLKNQKQPTLRKPNQTGPWMTEWLVLH
jgi:hypothetical protein